MTRNKFECLRNRQIKKNATSDIFGNALRALKHSNLNCAKCRSVNAKYFRCKEELSLSLKTGGWQNIKMKTSNQQISDEEKSNFVKNIS